MVESNGGQLRFDCGRGFPAVLEIKDITDQVLTADVRQLLQVEAVSEKCAEAMDGLIPGAYHNSL